MRILFVGDVFGRPGRALLRTSLRRIVDLHAIDFVIANVENAAAGFGLTRKVGDELLRSGVDAMTSGNHIWDRKEALAYIDAEPRLLRPVNYPPGVPGRGAMIGRTADGRPVGIVNLMGRVFMPPVDNPFAAARREVDALAATTRVIIVDFHAEATSEKIAMGWFLDGSVTAVIGTHTHVQTADNRVLPGGSAYITDVGMTGPHESIIGTDRESALRRFLTGLPTRFEVAGGDPRVHAVVVMADEETGRAQTIERLSLMPADLDAAEEGGASRVR
jgi:metallophosphoesterase (TIGR00282 family)